MFFVWRSSLSVFAAFFGLISSMLGASVHAGVPAVGAASAQVTVAAPRLATRAVASKPVASKRVAPAATPKPSQLPVMGVYAGPDSKGVAGAAAFGAFAGSAPQAVLDFAATDSWSNITGPNWLLNPWVGNSARLEYSLPMLPDGSQYTLAACASGAYDAQWRTTAQSLVNHKQANAIVRPGWEFNGTWYHWSAKNDINGYVGCFRHIVIAMRSVGGQHFAFDWNPSLGANAFPAEQAYPGDAYVDYVGVDIYDTSWSHYPSSRLAAAQAAAWNDDLNGNHGLAFWSGFVTSHHKSMAITEWGVSARSDGHGGGDDPTFVDHMFAFMTDAANRVAYGHYFDWTSSGNDHKLTGATRFPASAAEYQKRSKALTSR